MPRKIAFIDSVTSNKITIVAKPAGQSMPYINFPIKKPSITIMVSKPIIIPIIDEILKGMVQWFNIPSSAMLIKEEVVNFVSPLVLWYY